LARLLGIDVGGTKIAFAIADSDGNLLARERRPTAPCGRPEDDVARLLEDARALLDAEGLNARDLEAVGLSLPGPVDCERGCVLAPPNLPGWNDVPIAHWVAQELGCPVRLENDANTAALAEWRFGAARGAANVVYLTMSTGVGGGVIAEGQLVRGQGGHAGEVGHVPVEWEGRPCACGQRGCLEAYVGGRSWSEQLREHTPESSRVFQLAGGRAALSPEHVVQAAHEADAFACSELERWNGYLVRGIVGIAFTLSPDIVVLGTIAAAAGEALCLAPVRRMVKAHVWPGIAEGLSIRFSELGADLPYYAGVCAARYGLPSGPR
jgi:glucokinase